MRKWIPNRLHLPLMFLLLGGGLLPAQKITRTLEPQPATPDGVNAVACVGTMLLDEDFESGIPGTWTVIDGDGLTPNSLMGLGPGWQHRVDYRDTTNHVAVSPSWYNPVGTSNDWIITPAIALGTNPCLSWTAFSQDGNFKESYEIRVSTTLDTAAFLANAIVDSVSAESSTPSTHATSLAQWAGQTVYIAFRQTSTDKFVLVLDNIRVTNVNAIDIGVYDLTYGSLDPGDTVRIRFQVANYGSDTITNFQALYTVENGPAQLMTIGSVSIPPQGTLFFNHDSIFVSDSLDMFYNVCAWTTLPNSTFDQAPSNDTNCVAIPVGNPVGRPEPQLGTLRLEVYPNPSHGDLRVMASGLERSQRARIRLVDLEGRVVAEQDAVMLPGGPVLVEMEALPAGMYFLDLRLSDGRRMSTKVVRD